MNKKGFTLVELLGTIVIIALVIGGITFGVISIIKETKKQGSGISTSSIEKTASIYAEEKNNDEDYWNRIDNRKGYEGEYFCITIGELQNKGLLDNDINFENISANLENPINKSTYVGIRKDLATLTKSNPILLDEESTCDVKTGNCSEKAIIYGACTGNILNEKVTKKPTIGGGKFYTDEITNMTITDVIGDENLVVETRTCLYGNTSSSMKKEGIITTNDKGEMVCNLPNQDNTLEDEKTYYVKVCNTTKAGSSSCSAVYEPKTAKVNAPNISLIKVDIKVKIDYDTNTNNIKGEAKYYFTSNKNATSDVSIKACTNNDKSKCTGADTTSVVAGTLYETTSKVVNLTYNTKTDSDSESSKVSATICDKSGNCNNGNKTFDIYETIFKKGTADSIDGKTTDISKLCMVDKKGDKCTVKSPSIVRSGYTVVGWNTSSSATTSIWNANTNKTDVINSKTYYPITKIGKYTLTYNTLGGTTIASQTVEAGTTITVTSSKPTKAGNQFANKWNTKEDGTGDEYVAGDKITLNSNITLYAVYTYNVPIISCNNVYSDDRYELSATNGRVRIKVTDADGDLDAVYYNKSYFDPITFKSTNDTIYVTDAKTNMIRIYAMDKSGHISSNQMPEWSTPTGENGIVECNTRLDLAPPNTPIAYILKTTSNELDLSGMTNIKDIETDCCIKKGTNTPYCTGNIDRNVIEDQSCTITAYRKNTSSYSKLKYRFWGEDWFGKYIKENDGDMFEALKITAAGEEDYYYLTSYNSRGKTCTKKCYYGNADNCTCMSNSVKDEIYLVDKVGHKSKTLTVNIVWK